MIQGREISDAQVQTWADEAEAGYDVEELQKRWGRPPRAVPTRFSDKELAGGLDTAGRLLEIVVLLWDDGEVEIIHAMKARAAYRRLVS